jgi:PAS domain S-box-containing protein
MNSPKRDRRSDAPNEIAHPRRGQIRPEALTSLLHELQVQQQELTAQNNQLIATQRALEDSRDRYADLYDFAPIGFMTLDASGIVLEINLTGASLLRSERGRIIGLPFNIFVATTELPRFLEHLRQCRQLNRVSTAIELNLKANKASHVQLVTQRHGNGKDDKPIFLTALIDISDRKRLEQERGDAEEAREKLVRDREIARARADAKDHFLATLSHELRTPLTPIMATMSNDRLVALAPEPLRQALQTVRRNLDLEIRLIDDLLDVTRISRGRLTLAKQRVDVHQTLREVVEMLGNQIRQRGVEVTTRLDAPKYQVVGDPTRLRQVFWNLLGNALKFSSPGGTVTISSSGASNGSIEVQFRDAGTGMDANVVNSINEQDGAEPLPMSSATGLGLGLAICRGVISAHNGMLHAASAGRGHGSTFIVEIPLAAHQERRDKPVAPSAQADKQHGTRRILLVEDHQDSADTLSQLLTYYDYHVSIARNMEEAISIADEHFFDLLISDIRLPDGSGLELMRRLQSHRPIRGIAISGFGTEQDQQRSREAGYETHLTKPVDFDRLLEAIETLPPPTLAG